MTPDPDRPCHTTYLRHIDTCQNAAVGRRCHECRFLALDADAEDWRRWAQKLKSTSATPGA